MQPEENKINIFLKITFLAIILIVLNLLFGQKNTDFTQDLITAKAQDEQAGRDESTPTCTDKISGKISIGSLTVDVGGPNELEMPIGEATDDTEKMAEDIMKELEVIISASQSEINSATNIVNLAKDCNEGNCQGNCEQIGGGCYCAPETDATSCPPCPDSGFTCNSPPDTHKCSGGAPVCKANNCSTSCPSCSISGPSGGVCPVANMEGIATEQQNIESQVDSIRKSVGIIEEKFTAKNHPPIGAWKLLLDININLPKIGPISLGTPLCGCVANTGACLSPLPLSFGSCTTEENMILDKLFKARSGDYSGSKGVNSAVNLIQNPPGLVNCVSNYSQEMGKEENLPEEQPIQELLSCPQAIEAGYLNENPECLSNKEKCICYGSSKKTPERADNYVCCTSK